MSWFSDWYEEEHKDDYDKPSSVSKIPNKKSSRVRRREYLKKLREE